MKGAFETGVYRNVFLENGYTQEEIDKKIEDSFQTMFYGSEEERIYHPVGEDMGYMEDTGNHDARTEGMSYGMMMCVQMDKKKSSTVCGSGPRPICIWKREKMQDILRGPVSRMERRMRMDRRRTVRNFAMALFLHRNAGVTAREFSIILKKPGPSSESVFTRAKTARAALLCGKKATI